MRNVFVLSVAQFFGAFGQVTMVLLAGIIGARLAPDAKLATLPVTCGVIGIAMATLPAALAMQRFGRKRIFVAAQLWAAGGAVLAAYSLTLASFPLYCAASFIIGSQLAFMAQYRFAAAESVEPERVSQVVATVMLGTLGAALIAPWLVIELRGWSGTEYVGSFLALACAYLLGIATLQGYREPLARHDQATGEARPLSRIARQPALTIAVTASAVGYLVMVMIMTATPVSMHVVDRHSVEQTALVIQSHVLSMYLPSLLSGWLIARLGVLRMMTAGVLSGALCVAVAASGHSVTNYWGALVALGLGWNLLYVSGTTLLTRTYRPSERFKVQGLNDLVLFSISAIVSLLAGVLLSAVGWRVLNGIALAPLAIAMMGIGMLFWRRANGRADLVPG
jgi:MFS family permease